MTAARGIGVWVWCIGVLAAAPHALADINDAASAVAGVLNPAVEAGSVRSAVVGVVTADGQRTVWAFGHIGEPDSPAPDSQTVYELGPVTMVLTGTLLADLVERGEVDLETPVQSLLPQGVTLPTVEGAEAMTLLHLATHTSGLPPELETTVEAEAGGLSRDALFELVAKSPPAAAGSVYASKAIDGALVAELLAARAQSTYEAMLKQRVLDPLGMQDTGVAVTDEMVGRLATGFGGAAMVVEPVVFDAMAGGIGVRSTCDDMLTFAAANLDPSSSSIGPTLRAAKSPKVRKLAGGKAGLFWHVYPGGKAVRSVGQGRGFSAAIFVNERLGVAVVVLAATDDGSAVWSAVRSVMDTYKPAAADDE